MRVIQIPFCFYPDRVGGTEVYVEMLARELRARGLEVIVAAPGERSAVYEHGGLPVYRFAVMPRVADVRDLYGFGDERAAAQLGEILDRVRPDLVHMHAFTRGASLRSVREARARRVPVVFTYHTPTVSCPRGTLMRWGTGVCSGELDSDLCARCTLQGLGLPRSLAELMGRAPVRVGAAVGRAGLTGGLWTALRMRELISLRHTACLALLSEVDHIVVLCEWTRAVLTRIGVPPEKVTLSRHGVGRGGGGAQLSDAGRPERDGARRTLRAAFLGRLDPVKGAHVLVEAIRLGPDLPVALDLYGVEQGEASAAYLSRLRKIAGGDRRITFRDPVTPGTVTTRLRPYDLIAVPSQGLETGPLVVLEAFAAGVPVLGSRLGGIAELVEDSVDGLLVEPRSPEAWRRAFERLCHEDGLLARLREGIRPPRGMDAVASEMAGLYVHVCS